MAGSLQLHDYKQLKQQEDNVPIIWVGSGAKEEKAADMLDLITAIIC